VTEQLEALKKAIDAGGYNAAPSTLSGGSSLQMEDLSPVMNVATFSDSMIKLQKLFKVVPAKGTLVQFNRQLDYGVFGGSAVLEGAVGQEETSTYVRAVVPMSYYVHIRRVTLQSTLVQTFDGVKSEDRSDADAALKLAGDIEFHLFRGKSAYSNAGAYDGNPLAMADQEPGMHGLDPQIRIGDVLDSAKDLMFSEYGADQSIQINQNGVLSQSTIEDIYARAQMNHGNPEKLYIDPLTHSAYNKIAHNKERIVLAGSPQAATGASLKEQWVAGGAISIESSRFLSGKTAPARTRNGTPGAPTFTSTQPSSTTSFIAAEAYSYAVTAANEVGESTPSAAATVTITSNGNAVALAISPTGARALYYNVYRSVAGGTARKYIGRVKANGAVAVTFTDLNNRIPGFVTGFALDMRGLEISELSPFKSMDLARTDLTSPKAYWRFATGVVKLPRFNILVDNLSQ
jgi:hypothetical protein